MVELNTLRFVEDRHNCLIMDRWESARRSWATALGHIACRRRLSVGFYRTDQLLKRLKACRLDNSHESELRKLIRLDLLILDDFLLRPLDGLETQDVYEIVVERHLKASTLVTSIREPNECGWP